MHREQAVGEEGLPNLMMLIVLKMARIRFLLLALWALCYKRLKSLFRAQIPQPSPSRRCNHIAVAASGGEGRVRGPELQRVRCLPPHQTSPHWGAVIAVAQSVVGERLEENGASFLWLRPKAAPSPPRLYLFKCLSQAASFLRCNRLDCCDLSIFLEFEKITNHATTSS